MEKLQMDWLRSEDLKEEKNVTAPNIHNSTYGPVALMITDRARRNIGDMRRLSVGHPGSSDGDCFVVADILVREEPDDEEEEDDDSTEDEDDNGDGYSE